MPCVSCSKDTIRAGMRAEVFNPRMSGPTMTLEEFADLELADARRREERYGAAMTHIDAHTHR